MDQLPTTAAAFPTPDEAYANAPSIVDEIGWLARTLTALKCFSELDREVYLRKAALLDRIALLDDPDMPGDASMTADAAALYLLEIDQPGVVCDPRGYVRQQYARTLTADQ